MHYESWCSLTDEELAGRDIAEINLASAFGLPPTGELDVPGLRLTRREEMALFFAQRGHCLFDNLLAAAAAEAFGRAHSIAPQQPAHHNHWGLAVILHRAVEELKRQGAETPYATVLRMPPPKDEYEKRIYPVVQQHLNRILSNAKAKRMASPRELVFTEYASVSRLTNH